MNRNQITVVGKDLLFSVFKRLTESSLGSGIGGCGQTHLDFIAIVFVYTKKRIFTSKKFNCGHIGPLVL